MNIYRFRCFYYENSVSFLYLTSGLFNFVKHNKEFRMKRNKILIASFFIVALLAMIQCTSAEKRLHKQLSKMANNLNKSAPAAFDLHTRFDSAAVNQDNVFQYYYTVTDIDNPEALLRDKKKDIINNMEEAFATDRSLQIFVQNNVTMQYIYRDTLQNIIDKITIDAKQ